MTEVFYFKTRVVLERADYERLLLQNSQRGRLAVELRRRLEDEHNLLMLALHQLAHMQKKPDRLHFTRRWLAEHREFEDDHGVPHQVRHRGAGSKPWDSLPPPTA